MSDPSFSWLAALQSLVQSVAQIWLGVAERLRGVARCGTLLAMSPLVGHEWRWSCVGALSALALTAIGVEARPWARLRPALAPC